MICPNCKKDIEDVLVLSHGRAEILCPHCRRDPTGDGKLAATKENEEEFLLSAELFYRWLISKQDENSRKELLLPALRMCEEAAALGNPRAVVRMGYYYDRDYLGATFGEIQRCRFAFRYYYKAIVSGEIRGEENGVAHYNEKNVAALRRQAAKLLLGLLASAPEELRNDPMYDPARRREELLPFLAAEGGEDDPLYFRPAPEREETGETRRGEDRLFVTLRDSCSDRDRAPLLGVFRRTWGEAKALLMREVETGGKKVLVDYLKDRTDLFVGAAGADGNADARADFASVKNSRGLKAAEESLFPGKGRQAVQEGADEKQVWLCFFNGRGGKHRLSAAALRAIERVLTENRHERLREIVRGSNRTDLTLFDDDFLCYRERGRGWGGAVARLTEQIGEIRK